MAMMTASGRAAKDNDSARLQEPTHMGMEEEDPDLQPHSGGHPSRGSEDCMREDGVASAAAVVTSAASATSASFDTATSASAAYVAAPALSAAAPSDPRRALNVSLLREIIVSMGVSAMTTATASGTDGSGTVSAPVPLVAPTLGAVVADNALPASSSTAALIPSPFPPSPSSPFAAFAAGTRFSEDSAAPPRLQSVNSMLRHDILDSNFNSPRTSGSFDGSSSPTASASASASARHPNRRAGRRYEVAGEQSWWSIFGMEIKRDSEG